MDIKVLQIAPYMTCDKVPLLSQCKAGFGYMVYDIAKSLAKKTKVEALINNYRYREFVSDGVRFRPASFWLFLKNIFYCSNPSIVLRLWHQYHMPLRSFVRIVYVWLMSGYYYNVIRKGNYGIVHIHGCSFYDEIWMDICRRLNQKFIITLHGLNSFSDSISIGNASKLYERDFLLRVTECEFSITVISSGIKKTIIQEYKSQNSDSIFVVCNSFSFESKCSQELDRRIYQLYDIPEGSDIILYVGNISKNKNQEQLIRAFDLLPKAICEKTYVLFIGRNIEDRYQLCNLISRSKYKEHLVLCGNIDKVDMPTYYGIAKGVVLLSIREGFGLSLIEGMHFGKPCMTFCDLDAYEDIFHECAVVGIKDRSNKAVADGLCMLLQGAWDEDVIKNYSKRFEEEQMVENYLSVYRQIIER